MSSDGGSEGSTDGEGAASGPSNFIKAIIEADLAAGKNDGRVATRFPPEPNGYLHIGHAKSICLNFGLAQTFGGTCNLRFDDTNPSKEETEYVEAIQEDVRWLGFDWDGEARYASDYYEQLYAWAEELVEAGKAYVDDQGADEIREHRGTLTAAGTDSPWRDRSPEENLNLFRRMRAGDFPDGSKVLRARIDMASPNLNLRDPVLYRIRREHHHRTGDDWLIYPMYDFAHGESDAIEGITHSICTLEFEDHRPLYDWFLDNISAPCHPRQYEFARLELTRTVMSKRKLLELVQSGVVSGWDDPRMPTLSGMRRRGYPPEAIRDFCERIGVAKRNSEVEVAMLEHCVRTDLNVRAPRVMAVLRPLRLVIANYPDGQVEDVEAINNPEDEGAGTRALPFSKVLYVEADDFKEEAPRKWFRLAPGKEVRLKHAYLVTCDEVVKNDAGEVVELRCTYDPESRGGEAPDGRRVRGTLHWVSAEHAIDAEVRLYDYLLRAEDDPEAADEPMSPDSLEVLTGCKVEPSLATCAPGEQIQFLRKGYFCVDPDSDDTRRVFNRTLSLRDTWARMQQKAKGG